MENHYFAINEQYEQDADFFEMFEADEFDKSEQVGNVWKGYMYNEDEELVQIAQYTYNAINDEDDTSGEGWYNDELLG